MAFYMYIGLVTLCMAGLIKNLIVLLENQNGCPLGGALIMVVIMLIFEYIWTRLKLYVCTSVRNIIYYIKCSQSCQ